MPGTRTSLQPIENRLLSSLPREEYALLLPNLQRVHLAKGTVLWHAGDNVKDCYFPVSDMISLLSITEDGDTVEVSMVGNEGVVVIAPILQMHQTPYEVMVQVAADAMRIKADVLKTQFNRGGTLYTVLLRYTHALLCQISQSAICNRFHTTEQRLCRWLLINRDRVQSDTSPLTQECIAHMLGAPRTHVTMMVGKLKRAGLIRHTHGQITIADRPGLEAAACECYRVVKEEIAKCFT